MPPWAGQRDHAIMPYTNQFAKLMQKALSLFEKGLWPW